jgi:hypothetical protein
MSDIRVLLVPNSSCRLVFVPVFISECMMKMCVLIFFHIGALYFSIIFYNNLYKVLSSLFLFLDTDCKTLS